MRKKYNIPVILGAILLVFGLVGCDKEQEVEPVIDPYNYALGTFTTDFTGTTVAEGDTITYTVTLSKMMVDPITFSARINSGTADNDDIEVVDGTIAPYTLSTEVMVIFTEGIPELAETIQLEFGPFEIPTRESLSPATVNPVLDLTIENYYDPTLLLVGFSWPTDDDIDIVSWSDTDDYPLTEWGDGGASGHNPELDDAIWLSDPVGNYYINIMNWGVPMFNYTFSIGHPDGTVQFIDGTFDSSIDYTNDLWTAWGGEYDSFRTLLVVNDGTKFTVSAIN